jgi:hypothetical protein
MRESDLETLLRWRNHPDVRKCMLSQHEITLAEHRAWFDRSAVQLFFCKFSVAMPSGC